MIHRLRTSLDALRQLSADDLQARGADSLRRDCADALRLQLDCLQADLGESERHALRRLSDLLEEPGVAGRELADAVRAASAVASR